MTIHWNPKKLSIGLTVECDTQYPTQNPKPNFFEYSPNFFWVYPIIIFDKIKFFTFKIIRKIEKKIILVYIYCILRKLFNISYLKQERKKIVKQALFG